MKPGRVVRVKICCIASLDEAWMAIDHGASALGLVSEMPSGPGPIPEEVIGRIAAAVPPGVSVFLLTSKRDAPSIMDQHRRLGPHALQLCDRLPERVLDALRHATPPVRLVQVVHVTGEDSVAEAEAVAPRVDAILLDSGRPEAAVKELGGTGRVHDWSLSRRIRERVDVPVWLAGGLTAANVEESIERVEPFGVDVCTGVRTDGRLDETKLASFMRAVPYLP